jgi:hypothetical protein
MTDPMCLLAPYALIEDLITCSIVTGGVNRQTASICANFTSRTNQRNTGERRDGGKGTKVYETFPLLYRGSLH